VRAFVLFLAVALLAAGAALYWSRGEPVARPFDGDPARLLAAYAEERSEWDSTLAGPDSPLPPDRVASFERLEWFPPDPSFRFEGPVERFSSPEPMEMADTKGGIRRYIRWARFRFEVDGKTHALTIFRDPGGGGLFVPFLDRTSGRESYAGGRYVEADSLDAGRVAVDFNRAYNPYCVYDARWSCPIPPEENRLAVEIRAGMKHFAHGSGVGAPDLDLPDEGPKG
jgi:uncharacterized protein (DUF1684 family)